MIFKDLKKLGILGMNQRIGKFILPLNQRNLYPFVDDKTLTFSLAQTHNIPMPMTYFEVTGFGEIRNIQNHLNDLNSFVIKPARGGMGNGILVINKTTVQDGSLIFHRGNKTIFNLQELQHHLSGILSGLYSLNGNPDKVIIQETLGLHSVFDGYVDSGIPDIRIILLKGVPVLAMVRIPTRDSGGRANLHQGAVGVGIDMLTGRATSMVHRNKLISTYDEFDKDITEFVIPEWKNILKMAAKTYEMVPMGYLGVDIVLDPNKGPVLLELNARPGLAIQLANRIGLERILLDLEIKNLDNLNAEERVQCCEDYWSSKVSYQ
ncbi:alpha-L-glutamate ligase-like protein [Leptospira sp. GIMC2001]|uniref:alpha-L-glutamate ligase-like protein n=1 Tax=Leptospira sp. GIMC2001 TaxID=1513297 RepID=UPI00234A720A|nr:alpha-L-glutamate ligase-like protein [Leptospira sp. GIMC2001]WCL50080.1 alpha-L-glutamate ligase-like protein [Leptospira sp. GIMC2001]